MTRSPLIQHILDNQFVLTQIDFWREIFMIPDRMTCETKLPDGQFVIKTRSPLYRGKLFVHEGFFHAIDDFERIDDRTQESKTYKVSGTKTAIVYDDKESEALARPKDPIDLSAGEILNYPEGPTLQTTLGVFLINYIFLVYPFGERILFVNDNKITTNTLEHRIAFQLLDAKVTTSEVKDKYINALSLFGQATEIFCPNISEKTLSIPDEIDQLRDRLLEENKEALAAGDAAVMSSIEQQLISAYKEHLKGDSSTQFLTKSKYYNVTLKKLFLSHGMVEDFGSPGKFKFISQPMGKGWQQEDLTTIFNEVRAGSYARAIETADGGVITKLILRVLQDTRITVADCGTTRGDTLTGTKDQLGEFLSNYIVEPDGSTTLITDENIPSLVGKTITIRTPGYCQADDGYCAKCFGKTFERLGQSAFAPIANGFGKTITTLALKRMHGKEVRTVNVDNINKYLL